MEQQSSPILPPISTSSPLNSTPTTTNFFPNPIAMESVVTLSIPVAIKLNETNFLTWKSQILPIIHGYDLTRFLNAPPPNSTIRSATGEFEINPVFPPWHRQDQLLLGWLRSSLTETILAQVILSSTTRDLWRSLEDYFASTSRARLHELKRQIQTASKGDQSCSEYLLTLHRIADKLSFIGAPLPKEELVSATINGLGSEYNSVVAAVSATRCHGAFNFSDLRGLLLGHEALLKSQMVVNFSAFYAGSGRESNNSRYRPPTPTSFPTRPINSGSNTNGILGSAPEGKSVCQICNKTGHIAKMCFKRYDPDQDWRPPNSRFKAYAAQPNHPTQPANEWIIDSGVNNHVTNDINNLSSFFAYNGPDKLQIGNGTGLSISYIGNTTFCFSNLSLQLTNVLCVPSFSTNLISLSKLLIY